MTYLEKRKAVVKGLELMGDQALYDYIVNQMPEKHLDGILAYMSEMIEETTRALEKEVVK